MIKADLINRISKELNIPKQEAETGVNLFFDTIKEAILQGEEIEVRGFGSFRFRQRPPRSGRNPRTGDPVKVPPKKVLYFKPSKLLKELINKE
jgi:integration host factor subunit beta